MMMWLLSCEKGSGFQLACILNLLQTCKYTGTFLEPFPPKSFQNVFIHGAHECRHNLSAVILESKTSLWTHSPPAFSLHIPILCPFKPTLHFLSRLLPATRLLPLFVTSSTSSPYLAPCSPNPPV